MHLILVLTYLTGSWIVVAYRLFLAGSILAFGRAADNGRIQQIFVLEFAVFSFGSILCTFAPSLEIMVTSRTLQGGGASMIAAVSPLIITRFMPKTKRSLRMGVIATTGGIALTFGPPLGGLLTSYLSWNWVFLTNLPIEILAIIHGMTASDAVFPIS